MIYHRSLTRLIPVVLFLVLAPKVAAKAQAPAQEGPKHRRVAGIRDVTGSVSPDGRYYAFTNWQTGQLGVKDLSTGENRYIVTPGSEGESPYAARFAPDGRYIAYDLQLRDDSPDRDIFLLEIDGGREIPLVEGPGIERVLDWTPDGKRLLFDSDQGLLPGTGRRAWLIEVVHGEPIGEPVLVEPEIRVIRGLGFSHDGAYFYCCGGQDAYASPTSLYLATLDPATGELSVRR
ncbi:MAG: PD40 domain-containing protein [Gemmatimonadota bacterium]|nr:MAG: PD40 domain-containing protein [Gemmatimonadota bacterium]